MNKTRRMYEKQVSIAEVEREIRECHAFYIHKSGRTPNELAAAELLHSAAINLMRADELLAAEQE